MTKTELQKFREQLHSLREEVRSRIEASMEAVVEEIRPIGDNPQAPSEGLDAELAVEHNEGELFLTIDAALERIDAGTFGRCTECGTQIPMARLTAIPYAAYCIACERKIEAEQAVA